MDKNLIFYDIVYSAGGTEHICTASECEHFELKTNIENDVLSVYLEPKCSVEFKSFSIRIPRNISGKDRMFVNGYQSWTDSMEYAPNDKMDELTKLTEVLVKNPPLKQMGLPKSGDSLFWHYPRVGGVFYGWSYGYIRNENNVEIYGSLDERCGFTAITFDCNKNCVVISKDLEGVTYRKNAKILELAVISGEYDSAFDEYFAKMGVTSRENKRRTGYTTWYNYYGGITEQIVNRDLNSIANQDTHFDCFQIDDGYQENIGDWLITDKKKFPNGMKKIAEDIHSHNMIAGLWLAPFAGTRKSKLFSNHPEWFIKDENGRPYNTGHNWGGFYSLDIYNKDARKYIMNVFDTVLNDWGYDLVKLDFLYGACVRPMYNKTRGEIMCDAMDLLREACGDKLILGCGVPLMPAFGKVDYCRIGADISLKWQTGKHITREDVSTPHAVCNSIFRRHLDGRAWMNDPDVFLLREKNNQMNFEQRKLLAKINSTFGSLLFISDDVSEYNDEQKAALSEVFAEKDIKIISSGFDRKDVMHAVYIENGEEKELRFNIRTGEILNF